MSTQPKQETVLTGAGWLPLADVDLSEGETQCADCDQLATTVTECNPQERAFWAQCSDCASESYCQGRDAQAQSEYEMDYYSGYE